MDKKMLSGVVVKATSGFYFVQCGAHVSHANCEAAEAEPLFRMCRDRVTFSSSDEESGTLEEILPRDSFLKRPEIANVNQAILTFAANRPLVDFGLLDRFLVLAELSESQSSSVSTRWIWRIGRADAVSIRI